MQYIETGYYFYSSDLIKQVEALPEGATIARLWIWFLCAAKGRQSLTLYIDFGLFANVTGERKSEVEKALEHMERLGIVRTSNHRQYNNGAFQDIWTMDDDFID